MVGVGGSSPLGRTKSYPFDLVLFIHTSFFIYSKQSLLVRLCVSQAFVDVARFCHVCPQAIITEQADIQSG